MKLALVIVICGASVLGTPISHAQSKLTHKNYSEARKLYNEFDKTLQAMALWEKKKPADRIAAMKAAVAHSDRITRLWGDFSACSSAAVSHVDLVTEMNRIVSVGEGAGGLNAFTLLGALSSAEQFGNHRAGCYDAVEALDTPARKP